MQKAVSIAVAIAFMLSGTLARADDMPPEPWHPPAKGVVQDQRAAITIAHAVWLSMNPDTDKETGNEAAWQSMMKATLTKGVWEVVEKKDEGLVFDIARRDGRIINIYVVQ
jgi:hypothetical protein